MGGETMYGVIIGDVAGSVYERNNIKTTRFKLIKKNSTFTDDTVMTVAIEDGILNKKDYRISLKEYGRLYPNVGYGKDFKKWIFRDDESSNESFGNGAAMRVCPIGFAYENLKEVLSEAEKTVIVSHNHKEAVKGAQAVAAAVFLARKGFDKIYIKNFIAHKFSYNLEQSLDQIRPVYQFDSSCQGSVPQAIIAFLESDSYIDAIRKAISIGGDSDTIAAITGGIAQVYYKKIPEDVVTKVKSILDSNLRRVVEEFDRKYNIRY